MSNAAALEECDARDNETYERLMKMIDDNADSAAFECIVKQLNGPMVRRVYWRLRSAVYAQGQPPDNRKWYPLKRLEQLLYTKYPPQSAGGLGYLLTSLFK